MTLYETIDFLKKIALKHPNIGSASEGNIYEYMNANPSVKYGVFFITQGTHSQDEMFNHFEFTLFYVDRLVDDMEENRLQIQSIGKEILSNILTFFCEEFDAECENISFQPFTQRFVDETAGIYSTITIDVPKDVICPEEYWKEDWVAPVTVIRNQDKRVVFTENGTYTIDYDPTIYTGLGTVEVDVNIDVDSYYNNGYNQGKTDGIDEQKSKLESISITENGTYSKEDGYNHIEVNVPDLNGSYDEGYAQGHTEGYNEGKTDGVNEQKGKLSQIKISENGTYANENGYSEVVVDVPDLNGDYNEGYQQGHTEGYAEGERIGYAQGKTDGVNEQKGKLSQITISENGTYSKEDGYREVVVNVPDLNGSYDEGYNQGKTDGVNEQKSKLEAISITENGTYSREDGYNHIEVNVLPKINVKKAGLRFGNSTFTEVPEWVDFDGVTDMYGMFQYCSNLQTIPLIDTSNVKSMSTMFSYCNHLQAIPLLNTSNVTNMYYMFYYCEKLQTIPSLDTSKVTNMTNMFYGCSSLQTIPPINTSNVTNMSQMFNNCRSLVSLPALNAQSLNMQSSYGVFGNSELPNLTDFGGFLNLKCSLTNDRNLKRLPNLTYESCINVLNGLYDFTGNGETPNSSQGQLKVAQSFIDKVGDEISIGVAKGWVISA